MFEVKISV